MKIADRMDNIKPFEVMAILARARQLEAAGRDIIHMEIGEPDFPPPPLMIEAAHQQLKNNPLRYTPAAGLEPLREALSADYRRRYGLRLDSRRIFLTPGASGALMLALGVLVNPSDHVLIADPGYPCYPNFIRLFEGIPRRIPVGPDSGFNLSAAGVRDAFDERTRGIILASPSNPTGTVLSKGALHALVSEVLAHQGFLVSDEIYHGLEYGRPCESALTVSDDVFVINSFSKFYGMTGWRLGWMVVPDAFVDAVEKLAQNLFIAAPTLPQLVAVHAFDPRNLLELEARRQVLLERRNVLRDGLLDLGFQLPANPEGAFYIYADVSKWGPDSGWLAHHLLEEAGVAVTPGRDFGDHDPERYLRFCYTAPVPRIQEGLERIAHFLKVWNPKP